MTKFVELSDAASKVKAGDLIAIGGNNDHSPMAIVREIIRQGATGLRLVFVPAGGINGDMLMGAGSANWVETGSLTFGERGFAPNYRRLASAGKIKALDST
jgi:acyl CoA:acetate/3-ketoacid CoA transferase alpha subunit